MLPNAVLASKLYKTCPSLTLLLETASLNNVPKQPSISYALSCTTLTLCTAHLFFKHTF